MLLVCFRGSGHYLILSTPANVKFVFIRHDWLVVLSPPRRFRRISFVLNNMSQTVKDLAAGTTGGIAQVKPLL
jgi:hypothetical protein